MNYSLTESDDKFNDECGVFGVYNNSDAAAHCALGLHALQHRGQEAAGIVSSNHKHFFIHKAIGHVGDTFSSKEIINRLVGDCAIGHVRYSTSGDKQSRNIQPLFAEFNFGGLAIAHNGNITNANILRKNLIQEGAIFQSTMDSEIFIHLIAKSRGSKVSERIVDALSQIKGAFSLVALTQKKLIGARDINGVRPLALGQLGDSYVLSSESCGFDIIGAKFIRDIEPGELIIIDSDGIHSSKPFGENQSRFCIFEYIYFSRPDSIIEGKEVYTVRKNIGAQLARENKLDADVVVPVPDSGVPAALGFSQEAGIPFELGIIRNHYIGRTFIEPTDQVRNLGVKLKHNSNSAVLKGKRVILVDDSIVRGTTSKKIVSMVREAGAKEVHMLIASPPTTDPCFYGVDTPSKEKLIAANNSIDEMAKIIGADSLKFLSVDGMYKATCNSVRDAENPQYCDACFTGQYPIELTDQLLGTCQMSLFTEAEQSK